MQLSSKTLTPAGKTSNIYRLTKKEYNKMRTDTGTSTSGEEETKEKKCLKMDVNAESNCFMIIKD